MKRKFGISALFLLLTLLLTACPATNIIPQFTPDFSVSAGNVTIEEGATGEVSITITPKDGFDDLVALSINNPVDINTAIFQPVSTKTTSTLTLGSNKEGTYTMTVTGKSGAIERTAELTLTVTKKTVQPSTPPVPPVSPTTVTLTGVVIDGAGHRFPNLLVVVLGQEVTKDSLATTAITTTSNADGEFTLSGVKKPYDIAVIKSIDGDAIIYKGLSNESPVLTFIDQKIGTKNTATLQGKVNQSSEETLQIIFGSPDVFGGSTSILKGTGPMFSGELTWPNDKKTVTGTAHVLQGIFPSGAPNFFYGSGPASLTVDTTTTIPDITMQAIGNSTTGGNITFPKDYRLHYIAPYIIFDKNTTIDFDEILEPLQTGDFSFVTPQVPDGKLGVYIETRGLGFRSTRVYKTAQTLNNINMSFNIPAAPSLASPINNASTVTGATAFSWTGDGFTESVYVIRFNGQGGTVDNRKLTIVTTDTNTSIPDLTAQGLTLAAGKSGDINNYNWRVSAIGPVASIDEATAEGFGELVSGRLNSVDWVESNSELFKFEVITP